MVDYYSRYPEVIKLPTITLSAIITAMKSIFSRHRIPHTVIGDNGPQYTSAEMKTFASSYSFRQVTSSPYHPHGNGLGDRTVRTINGLLKETEDVNLTLLSYRATLLPWCVLSPSELLMSRNINTDVPQSPQFKTHLAKRNGIC